MIDKIFKFFNSDYGAGFFHGFSFMWCIIFICAMLFGRTGNDDNTTATIHSISGNQQSAINEIGSAISANRDAQSTLGAVGERINRSENIARDNAEKVDDIHRQLEECRNLVKTSGDILDEVGKADRGGSRQGKGN